MNLRYGTATQFGLKRSTTECCACWQFILRGWKKPNVKSRQIDKFYLLFASVFNGQNIWPKSGSSGELKFVFRIYNPETNHRSCGRYSSSSVSSPIILLLFCRKIDYENAQWHEIFRPIALCMWRKMTFNADQIQCDCDREIIKRFLNRWIVIEMLV